MSDIADITHGLLDGHARLKADAWAGDPDWLGRLRENGRARFEELGLPTQRLESWKYTSLRPLERVRFAPVTPEAGSVLDTPPPDPLVEGAFQLVFVDGRYRSDLSTDPGEVPSGVTLSHLRWAVSHEPALVQAHLGQVGVVDGHGMIALNTAFLNDGPVLHLEKGIVLDRPVEILFITTTAEQPAMWHPRVLMVAEPNSAATVLERHIGEGDPVSFANLVCEIVVREGARLQHYKLQTEATSAFHIATTTAHLAKDSVYDNFVLTAGARLSRNEIRAVLGGTGVTCKLNGAYMLRGKQHADTTTLIDHANPHCQSREVYHGAIDDGARAVFQGKIMVRPDAQKTDGYQLNRALLLSEHAEIDSKPELEIYADDVKCSHGATTGDLDEDALFYLRSRGLDRQTARGLLIRSFLAEALEEIELESVRTAFGKALDSWLEAR